MKTGEYKKTILQQCREIYADLLNQADGGKVDRQKALHAFMEQTGVATEKCASTYLTICRKEWK